MYKRFSYRNLKIIQGSVFFQIGLQARINLEKMRIPIKFAESPEFLEAVKLVIFSITGNFFLEICVQVWSVVLLQAVWVHTEEALKT